MKYYTIITISLLVIISLVIGYFLLVNNGNEIEGYQAFSTSQVEDMGRCDPMSNDQSCLYAKYYNETGDLNYGFFKNIPSNFYIDASLILQPVPFGNIVKPNKRGYTAIEKDAKYYSSSQSLYTKENIINPRVCKKTEIEYVNPTICYDVNYLTMGTNGNTITLKNRILMPDGYYVNNGFVNKIPDGYVYADQYDKSRIKMTDVFSKQVSKTKFDTNNYDVEYHTEPSGNMTDSSTAGPGKMWILDKSKNLVSVPYSDVSNNTLYYEPGSFRFSSSNYVPNYEETVYLSKLTNISTVSPIKDSAAMGTGFCDYYKNNPDELERICNDQSGNTCASTKCCVLLGGQKCVYGNESGPKFKSNYSNFLVTNPEFYYYQGKCYGNCK